MLNIGSKYKLIFDVGGNSFTYTGVIIELDDNYISFTDKYGIRLTYNKDRLISFEEVKDD